MTIPPDNGPQPATVELAILLALAQHRSLAADQIAAELAEEIGAIQGGLRRLRDRDLVNVLAVGEIQGHGTNAASSWTLTDAGLDYLAQLR